MITFYYIGNYGRLGNQMFQYATLYSVAKETGFQAILPIVQKTNNEYQNYVLDEVFSSLTIKNNIIATPKFQFSEKSCRFDPKIFSICDDCNLKGYFQTEMYFSEYSQDIKKEFTFKEHIRDAVDSRYSCLKDDYLVSLHVRRGDYVKLQDTHPLCTKEYYKNAIDLMPKDAKLLVISDDINWCKENLQDISTNIIYSENTSSYEDMYLMTKCKSNIIANSSFSWWGAWLADADLVVAPKQWFGINSPNDSTDIIPDRWIKI